jgi:hypothetical protein
MCPELNGVTNGQTQSCLKFPWWDKGLTQMSSRSPFQKSPRKDINQNFQSNLWLSHSLKTHFHAWPFIIKYFNSLPETLKLSFLSSLPTPSDDLSSGKCYSHGPLWSLCACPPPSVPLSSHSVLLKMQVQLLHFLVLFFIIIFLAVLGVELRALGSVADCLPLDYAPSPLCFSYFLSRVLYLCLASLNCNPPIYTSYIARMTCVFHHTQLLFIGMRSCKLFAWGASSHSPF